MQFQCTADNPGEAAIAEYIATIMNLQDRLCTTSAAKRAIELELVKAQARIMELEKPKEPPKLEAVPKPDAA